MEINQNLKENNTFEDIKELYDDNNNIIINTEGVTQIITNYIKNRISY